MNKIIEQPIPQGKYLSAVRHADLIYTSGMTPRKAGNLLYSGKIKILDPIESHKVAVRLATLNAITAAKACLIQGERISIILQLNVFLNAEEGFVEHAKIADYASDLIIENLGNNCIGSRAAIGVASLPSNATIEITLIAKTIALK
ncbi:RidA family protein [Flavobacteriaceae bacterium]|jgi:enamine deaminase RidA (YjgF/YER057c/UK114 family)|nr:RidA family protein [Flavobacteriaceae bacterium]|tara:strand:- start:19202 stop:19639 length:438 start_codon:yes stop_codon:yes gene_type:complete